MKQCTLSNIMNVHCTIYLLWLYDHAIMAYFCKVLYISSTLKTLKPTLSAIPLQSIDPCLTTVYHHCDKVFTYKVYLDITKTKLPLIMVGLRGLNVYSMGVKKHSRSKDIHFILYSFSWQQNYWILWIVLRIILLFKIASSNMK